MMSSRRALGRVLALSIALVPAVGLLAPAADAATANGKLNIVTVLPGTATGNFTFTLSRPTLAGKTSAVLSGATTRSLSFVGGSPVSISQKAPVGYADPSISCVLNGAPTGTVSGSSVTDVAIAAGGTTTCTFTENLAPVSLATTVSFSPSYLSYRGGDTTQTWSVKNTSPLAVTITGLDDSRLGPISTSTCAVGTTLAVGASCGGTLTLFTANLSGGVETSTFTASAQNKLGATGSATASGTLTFLLPSYQLVVTKTYSPSTLPSTGGTTTMTVGFTNNSSQSLTLGTINDTALGTLAGSLDCHAGTVLGVGQSCSFASVWYYSGAAGTSVSSAVWSIATLADGTHFLGERVATLSFS